MHEGGHVMGASTGLLFLATRNLLLDSTKRASPFSHFGPLVVPCG
jgi:hypothetical protein